MIFCVFAVMNIVVLLLTCGICVLFVDTIKARECNASYPCYSLFNTFELMAEEDKVEMFNGNNVDRNEVSMAHMFSARQARAVEGNVMNDIAPEDEIAAKVKHKYVENSAMKGIAALKKYEPKSKIENEEYVNQAYSGPEYINLRTGSKLEKLMYVRKIEQNFANCSGICSCAVFKNVFDEKQQLKVVVVNMYVTFSSFQLSSRSMK